MNRKEQHIMGTKAQLINFIIEKFQEPSGETISKSRLDGMKKSELEEFVKARGCEDEFKAWVAA